MVVALPLFMQNMDTSTMATALPTISDSLGVDPLQLNLAITAYLLSLAIFLPASGWMADRFGAKRVFCWAIVLFTCGSVMCATINSLGMLVVARVLQGMGGAMMVPVGRLILLRRVSPANMVSAMVWFTVPPAVGRMMGPLVGGAVVTWLSWRWIFLVTVPVSLMALLLAWTLIDADEPGAAPAPFDLPGFLWLGVGLASLLGGLETAASRLSPWPVSAGLIAAGLLALCGYLVRCRSVAVPLIDLSTMRFRTFFAAVGGAFPLRMAGGALPFLLPLMFQLAFGMSPMDSGLLTAGTALGALATRVIMSFLIRNAGFKSVLLCATFATSLCYAGYSLFTGGTPPLVLFLAMCMGGLVNSLVMVSLQTLAYSEVPRPLMGHATALATMVQQLSLSAGVLFGVELLRMSVRWRGGSPEQLLTGDFHFALLVFALIVLLSAVVFARLPRDVGAEMR